MTMNLKLCNSGTLQFTQEIPLVLRGSPNMVQYQAHLFDVPLTKPSLLNLLQIMLYYLDIQPYTSQEAKRHLTSIAKIPPLYCSILLGLNMELLW